MNVLCISNSEITSGAMLLSIKEYFSIVEKNILDILQLELTNHINPIYNNIFDMVEAGLSSIMLFGDNNQKQQDPLLIVTTGVEIAKKYGLKVINH